MSRCCLTFCGPEAAVCTVINLDECSVLVNNDSCAITVGLKSACVVLIKDPHCLGSCCCCGNFSVICPLAINRLKGLTVNGNELGVFMTCALVSANRMCAFCVCALIAMLANVLAAMFGFAYALLCTNFFCAFCICALAAYFANVLALMSGSFGEFNAGDRHLRTDCTVAQEERTGKVAGSAVGSYDEVFAILKGCKCLLEVFACSTLGCVHNAALVFCIVVLAVCTVVDANDLAVLIEDECFTPTVCPVERALVCGGVKNEEVRTENGKILVNRDLIGKQRVSVFTNQNLYKVVNNVNNASNSGGVCAVGCGKGNGVRTNGVDIKATVVIYGNLNNGFIFKIKLNVVGRIERAVIVDNGKTAEDCSSKIEFAIGQVSKNLVVVTGDYGCLVNVRSENLCGVCPKETNNVAVLVNYVVVHKAAAVGVNGGTAVAVLNNDCIAACRNGKVLCKCTCNGNSFTVDLKGGYRACGSIGVCLVNELGVCAVTAFKYKAVCINNSCYTVAACNIDNDSRLAIIVEYTADCYVGYVVAGKGYEFLILKGKKIALPLGFTKSVGSYLESESGECLQNGYLTGSDSSFAILVNCFVGDGVGSLNLCIKAVVVFNNEIGSFITFVGNGNTEHQFDIIACVDLERFGNYADNGSGFCVCRRSSFCVCGGCGLCVGINLLENPTCRKGEYKHHNSSDNCQKL